MFGYMKSRLLILLLLFFGTVASVFAEAIGDRQSIDPLCFLAGLCLSGTERGYLAPSVCESFFREGGEQRAAELFLEVANTWDKTAASPTPMTHYFDPNGNRLVVKNQALAQAIRAFYAAPTNATDPNLAYIEPDREKRLSFLAGVYARRYLDGAFHGDSGSRAMRAAVLILLAEGCEVYELSYDYGVPETIHFKVKPSKQVAQLFAFIDKWQPPHVEWKSK